MTIRRNAPAVFYIYTDGTGEITEQIPFEYLSSGDVHSQVARTDGRVIDPSKLHYFSSNRPGGVIERAKAFSNTNRWILIFENSLPFARAQGGFESAQLFSPSSMSVFLSEETSSGNFGSTQTPAFLYFSGGARNEFKFYVMAGDVTFPTTVAGGTFSSVTEQGAFSYATYTLPEEFDFNVGDFFSVAEIPVTNKIGKKTLDITRITIPVVTVTDIYSLASSDLYDSSTVKVALFDNTKFYVKVFRHTERTQLREFTDPGLEEAIDEMFLINQEQDSKGPIPGYGDEFISGAGYNDSVLKQGVSANKSDIAINKAGIAKNKLNTERNVQAIINQGISISTNKTDQTAVDDAQDVKIKTNKDAIDVNTADIAALPTGTAITGKISADEAKIAANEGKIATNTTNITTNTTNIGTNAHDISSLSTGSVQSNINAVARLGGQINTLDEKVFTTSSTPGVPVVDNILTNKNAIAKNKADIAATPSLVAHDAKEDKILRLTSSPNSPVAPSLLTAVTSGFVDPIYTTRVDFTSLVYNSTPPIQYTLALTEAPSLRIVKIGNNPPPKDAIFFPEGSLYITAKAGRVVADVPQTITLTFPSTVVTYTRPTKEPETITIVGPHFTVELEKYTYNFSGTAHALIPIGVGGVITTTGGTFEIDDMDVVEGNKGQRIIQVSVDKKLDIIWEKETTGVVADWFKLSTVGLDVAANTKGIAKNKADISSLPSKEDRILQIRNSPNSSVASSKIIRVSSGSVSKVYLTRVDFTSYTFNVNPPLSYTIEPTQAKSLKLVKYSNNPLPGDALFYQGGSLYITSDSGRVAADVPQTITLTFSNLVVTYTRPVKKTTTITIAGFGYSTELERYDYTTTKSIAASIPDGEAGVITTVGGKFGLRNVGSIEGKAGQKLIQVNANKALDILWEKETTGPLPDWFKLFTPGAAGSSKFVDLTDTEATVGNTDDIMTTKASGLIGPAPLVVHESNLDAGLQKHFLTPRAPVTTAKGSFKETVLLESYVGHGRSKKRATATQDSAYKSASAAFPLDTNVVLSTKMSYYIRTNDIRKAGDFWGDAYAIYNGSFWDGQYGDAKRAIRGATPSNPTPQRVAESALDNAGYTTMAVHDETLWVASAYPGAHTRVNNADRYALTTKVKRILNNKVITTNVSIDAPYTALHKITSGVIAATSKYLWVFSQLGERVIYTRLNPADITIDANGTTFTFNNIKTGQFFLGNPRHNVKLRFAFGNSRDLYLQFTKQFGTDWVMGTFKFGGISDNVNYNNSKCGTVTRSDTKGCYKMVDMDVSDTADIPAHAYNTANFKDFPNTNKLIKMAACYSPREFRTFFIVNNTYAVADREAIAYTTVPNSASLNPLQGIPGTNASFAVPIGSLLYVLIRNYDAARTKVQHAFFTVPIGEIDYSNENYSIQLGDVIYKITVIRKGGNYGIKELALPGLKVSILSPQFLLDTEVPRSLSVPFLAFGASNFVTVTKLPTIPDNYFFTFNYLFHQPNQGAFTEVFETGKVTGLSAGPIYIDKLPTTAFPSGTDRGLEFTITSGEILAYTVAAGGNTGPGVLHINNFSMTKN